MAKRRPTIPIAHADDVPTIAFTDENWQAIEHGYGRKLNAELRQQITIITTHYLKDRIFDRNAAPKAMARKRIKRIRRAAGDLVKALLDSEPFSVSSDDPSREQQQSADFYADGLIRRHLDERRSKARDRLQHFRDTLKSLVVACDCALGDLSATENCDDEPWNWWIQGLTRIAQEHRLPYGSRVVERSGEPSPFVALVRALQEHVPARHTLSCEALAKAIRRAQRRAGDK
jgi:hypothetical protein